MKVDVKQLRCFQQIYRDGSIQKAAANLFVSQQALSKALSNLESEMGVRLFERSSQGVRPTAAGTMLFEETADLVARFDALFCRVRNNAETTAGRVSFGTLVGHMNAFSRMNISALEQCRLAFPNIILTHTNEIPTDIENAIDEGRMDFGFSAFPSDPSRFECHKLYEFSWFIVMGYDHPLANRSSLEIEDLKKQRLIFPKGEKYDRQQIMRALGHEDQPEFIDASKMLYDVILQQLLPLKALTLCAEPHAPLLNPRIVRLVPFHTDLLRSQIYLIFKKGAMLSPAARQVLTYLLSAWQLPSLDRQMAAETDG